MALGSSSGLPRLDGDSFAMFKGAGWSESVHKELSQLSGAAFTFKDARVAESKLADLMEADLGSGSMSWFWSGRLRSTLGRPRSPIVSEASPERPFHTGLGRFDAPLDSLLGWLNRERLKLELRCVREDVPGNDFWRLDTRSRGPGGFPVIVLGPFGCCLC